MAFTIPNLICSDWQFRQQVIDALTDISTRLDAVEAGTGIANNSIALSKLAQVSDKTILGNRSGSTGNVTAVTDKGKWA